MSDCCDETAWINRRISQTRLMIEKYEDAILALSTGALTYSLDTGQTRQTMTKQNITSMRDTISMLENRLATLVARRDGGSVIATPGW